MSAPGPAAEGLAPYVGGTVSVLTNDGRHIVGLLRGYDQSTNLILEQCHERVYHKDQGVDVIPLGVFVVRGDNIAVVGEHDEEIDSQVDLSEVRAPPLKPITHG